MFSVEIKLQADWPFGKIVASITDATCAALMAIGITLRNNLLADISQ
jgi:hypothetical protein